MGVMAPVGHALIIMFDVTYKLASVAATLERRIEMAEVRLYSTPSCPYCRMAKDFLTEEGVDFSVVDVSEDEKAAQEMVDKSGQLGVPVMEVDSLIIVGFDRDAYRKALVDAGAVAKASQ